MNTLVSRRLVLMTWLTCISVALVAVIRMGGTSGVPTPQELIRSTTSRTPLDTMDVVSSVARVAVIVILAHLLVVTVLQLVAGRTRSAQLIRAVGRVTPRFLVVMAAGVIVSGGSAFATAGPGPAVVTPGAGAGVSAGGSATPTMEVIGENPPAHPLTSLPWAPDPAARSNAQPPVGPNAAAAVSPPAAEVQPSPLLEPLILYTVQPGDHLWGIAEEEVSHRSGSAATGTEVIRYWSTLIETNRDRLVDPDNPDLILPGQELVLPA